MYFLVAALVLGARYWVLPNIDQWRPYIAKELSQALGLQVRIGSVKAQWNGIDPTLELTRVDLTSRHGRHVLSLPRMRARLSWRSILAGVPRFALIQASGLDLTVHRDTKQRLWIMGQSMALDTSSAALSSADLSGLQWLITQRHIVFDDGTVKWVDDVRGAPELVLRHVTLELSNRGNSHEISLSAVPPEGMGSRLDVRGAFTSETPVAATTIQDLDGRMYAEVDGVDTNDWTPWFDFPAGLALNKVNVRAWARISRGSVEHLASTLDIGAARWTGVDGADVGLASGRLYLSGAWPTLRHIFVPPPGQGGAAQPGGANAIMPASGYPPFDDVEFRLDVRGLSLRDDSVFTHALGFDQVSLDGRLSRDESGNVHVFLGRAGVRNQDMDAVFSGSWRQGGRAEAGVADMRGRFNYASIAAIDDYLPISLSQDAHDWMDKGLMAGKIHDAKFVLQGDLDYFPFDENPDKGDFHVRGRYSNGVIDYVPAKGKQLGWPKLTDMEGEVELRRSDLRLVADTATISPVQGQPIHLNDVLARIPDMDMDDDATLVIQGDTSAPAMSYLALMQHSPLGGLLDHVFDQARADGTWMVPLQLTIPLSRTDDTAVRGAVDFNGGSVSPIAGLPAFTHVTGSLHFSDKGLDASRLQAQFMGGPVSVAQGADGASLQLTGTAQAKDLGDYTGLAGMSRVSGKLSYRATLARQASGHYALTVDSDLVGLGLDFPPPLKKSPAQSLPLHLAWAPRGKSMALTATLGKTVSVVLVHPGGKTSRPFFSQGALGVNRKTSLPGKGMDIDVSYPRIDIDEWRKVYDQFAAAPHGAALWESELFPAVRQLRLESDLVLLDGVGLDKVAFTLRPQAPAPSAAWRMDLSSAQSAGTILWREASAKRAGSVDAKFQRLALGRSEPDASDAPASDKDMWEFDGKVDIPAISLEVDKFTLYGHPMGRLSVQGVNQERGERWQLNNLHLGNASFDLNGSGLWRLSGPDRGLTLQAQAKVGDLGKYLRKMGFKNLMHGGKGVISGNLQWDNLPWTYKKSDLNGKFTLKLEKGSFNYQDSHTARLLKLLSLQSVGRLAKLEWNPANAIKDGFPYDNLRGTVELQKGVLKTENYRVIGPVGTIVLSGTTDLNTEKLDMQAVVIPNLDVSGAAIAAGIAINPVVGIGAFLAQWLLRAPLARQMASEYRISGDWDDPSIKEEPVKNLPSGKEKGAASSGKPSGPVTPVVPH